ncbi:hypothetical protein D9X30_1646 (plasmid) [Cupriavidus sp. U2]|nr:hypothetical protein D9X30_1646 [Cupriavidus sp. U2]
MGGLLLVFVIYLVPTIIAVYFAKKDGRSILAWGVVCVIANYLGLLAYFLTRGGPPTLDKYAEAHPENVTPRGMSCYRCGSRSIRVWREQAFVKVRQYHICNHCGTSLYRSR